MESSLEDLPKLYESVSKPIVRIERTGTMNVTGVIVSTEGLRARRLLNRSWNYWLIPKRLASEPSLTLTFSGESLAN